MKILVVDDDPAMTELLQLLLMPVSPIMISATHGREGIHLAAVTHPDLVILDMMMPEMNGKEVCEAIRKFSRVPIIILSALDTPGLVAAALDAGADDYLIKPVSSGELVAHIQNLLRRVPAERYADIEVG